MAGAFEVVRNASSIRLFSRNGADLTRRLSPSADLIAGLKEQRLVLDGEVAAIGVDGKPDFRALHSGSRDLAFHAFDLLWLGHHDLRPLPLTERLRILRKIMAHSPSDRVVMIESFDDGGLLLEACRKERLEGIVSKLRSSRYQAGPSSSWRKTKCAAWRQANRDRGELFERKRKAQVVGPAILIATLWVERQSKPNKKAV
jgi:bifunctional non-homologous end joining protein LigD